MYLTNKHHRLSKHNVLTLILSVYLIALSFPTKSYANSFGISLYSQKGNYQKTNPYNNTEKAYLNLAKKDAFDNYSTAENSNLESLRQISILLVLMVIMLICLIIILWKRNMALGYETLQIRSKLNQYTASTNIEEDLKSIQEEHKQQALILNERQQKIVDLMAFGFSNKQIADKLFISENTVKYHIKNIYNVLHVKDRKALWLSQS